jgi:hypothetical protein
MLSVTDKLAAVVVVVVPPTVKLPSIITLPSNDPLLNVTFAVVETSCPIAIVGVAPSPVLFDNVTPVPATRLAT